MTVREVVVKIVLTEDGPDRDVLRMSLCDADPDILGVHFVSETEREATPAEEGLAGYDGFAEEFDSDLDSDWELNPEEE